MPQWQGGTLLPTAHYALPRERRRNIKLAMDGEITVLTFSRPETTGAVTRGAARLLVALGYAPLCEVCLPNGRRADLMALGPKGEIVIAEVKSGPEDYHTDRKWPEYLPY